MNNILDKVIQSLNNYVTNHRYTTDPKALFTTKSGRMTYPYARKRIKEIGAKAGVPSSMPMLQGISAQQ